MPRTATPPFELQEATPAAIKGFRKHLHMTRSVFARLVGASERTVANWEAGANQPREMSERHLVPLFRLCQALLPLVDRHEIGPWFERPNPAFDGLKPIELIERGHTDRLWNMIYDLRAGTHA